MIATLPNVETEHTDFSSDNANWTAVHDRRKLVDIGEDHWREICTFFPVDNVHWRTKLRNEDCRLIVASFVRSALRSDDLRFGFNTKVLSKMGGSDKRELIARYFSQSKFCTVAKKHSAGNRCRIRTLSGTGLSRNLARQHKLMGADATECDGGTPLRRDMSGRESRRNRLPFKQTVWSYDGKTVPVYDPDDWFRQYGQRYRDARIKAYPEKWHFLPALKWSAENCIASFANYDECLKLADKSIEKKQRLLRWYEQRTGRKQQPTGLFDRDELARHYMLSWGDWCKDRLHYVKRIDGRVFYPLVNKPRGLRRSNMAVRYDDKHQGWANVDLSSAYYVLLASELRPSECKELLVHDLHNGKFYEEVDREAGGSYSDEDRGLLKIAIQIDCLFGKECFGDSENFKAMSRRYPELAALIMYRRKNHDVSWLSRKLTNAEGTLVIDCLLPHIVARGIPCLTMHDAVLVPESVAELVRTMCEQLTMERLGIPARFKVSTSPRETTQSNRVQSV